MPDFRARLAHRFRKQVEFSQEYAPFYAHLFGLIGAWLGSPDSDPVADWLVQAADGRQPFDVPLLLLAGVHRDVLAAEPAAAELAAFYPTAGGRRAFADPQLVPALRHAILARRAALANFIRNATVQTNETGRGLAWLLPSLYTGWDAVHLVDLGASAGLNLAADQRHYQLQAADGRLLLNLGAGHPPQFITTCKGSFSPPPPDGRLPVVLSRTGCDVAPFLLETAVDEQTLSAFIWADQVNRMTRLREGIAAYHQVNRSRAPVKLAPVDLPDGLPRFLRQNIPPDQTPVLVGNTYMTIYLRDRGAPLREHLATWAVVQPRPVLWVQWEPAWKGPEPPEYGWVSWTADLWQDGEHHHWQLAWVHPHGGNAAWLPDLLEWSDFWRKDKERQLLSGGAGR